MPDTLQVQHEMAIRFTNSINIMQKQIQLLIQREEALLRQKGPMHCKFQNGQAARKDSLP